MRIIKDCWNSLGAIDCQYGAQIFDGANFSIYVNNWLFVSEDIASGFSRQNDEGCVGHCVLKFCNVAQVAIETSTYRRTEEGTVWDPVMASTLSGLGCGREAFDFSGSLKGFASSVDFHVVAGSFELHILDKDEPARE